jgi:NAD(P)-dependent dehydrogenase (short-subunit alcohol dehydrogenase family)
MDSTLDATESQIQKMFEINYLSTFSLIQATLPHVRKHKGSYVIISTHGAYVNIKQSGHYTNTKLMMNSLTRQLATLLI